VLWLFLAFIVLPVLEIWIITQVAGPLGWPLTLLLVIGVSVSGAWLVRREGLGVIRRVRDGMREARLPTRELADGAMVFFAAALMLTPGFLTDAIGLALLLPPIRALIRPPVVAFFRRRLDVRVAGSGFGPGGFGGAGPFAAGRWGDPGRDDVVDVDGHARSDDGPDDDAGRSPRDPPELG
jgi:UPF0716 protein FxsA